MLGTITSEVKKKGKNIRIKKVKKRQVSGEFEESEKLRAGKEI